MATRKDVAERLFPHVSDTIESLRQKQPVRPEGLVVTRFAPSPTGFLHIWWVRTSLIAEKYATQNNGVFYLRIEDTDQKRLIENGIGIIVSWIRKFWIPISEWPLWENYSDVGSYGPYVQSQRAYFYHTFVKQLVAEWKAYPCWMTTEEVDALREQQRKTKVAPWIYGNYSVWRNKTPDEILVQLDAEKVADYDVGADRNFAIRFRSFVVVWKMVVVDDILRGKVNMQDNFIDVPILKSMWLPTYHMAHVVDDYLMGTYPIIRADERFISTPLHLQLYEACGLPSPIYCHPSAVLKLDEETWNKRKLSKRKDPEADVQYYFEHGYATEGIINYLMWLIDSWFEDWYVANPEKSYKDYEIDLTKMNKAWSLYDLQKLNHVHNAYISKLSNDELFEQFLAWAQMYRKDFFEKISADLSYAKSAMSIERHTEKDPKRFTTFKDVEEQLVFFFDDYRKELSENWKLTIDNDGISLLPEVITKEVLEKLVTDYLDNLSLGIPVEEWFEQLKLIGKKHGFASNNAEFKEGGYIGKVGDIAMFLRVQLCGTKKTPDLYSVMKVMWKERVGDRLRGGEKK